MIQVRDNDGNNDSETDEEDDTEQTGSCSSFAGDLKPVRLTAGHVLYEVIQQRFSKEKLRLVLQKVVDTLILAAEAEREGDECNGIPMRICHLVAGVSEEDLLPHMENMVNTLFDHCYEQIVEGQDMSESVTLEAIGMVATSLLHLWSIDDDEHEEDDEDNEDDDDGEHAFSFGADKGTKLRQITDDIKGPFMRLLQTLWLSDEIPESAESAGIYLNDAILMLRVVMERATNDQDSEQLMLIFVEGLVERLCLWVGTCEVDYAEDAWTLVKYVASNNDKIEGYNSPRVKWALLMLATKAFADGDDTAVTSMAVALRSSWAENFSEWMNLSVEELHETTEYNDELDLANGAQGFAAIISSAAMEIHLNQKSPNKRAAMVVLIAYGMKLNAPKSLETLRLCAKKHSSVGRQRKLSSGDSIFRFVQDLTAVMTNSLDNTVSLTEASQLALLHASTILIEELSAECSTGQRRHLGALLDACLKMAKALKEERQREHEEVSEECETGSAEEQENDLSEDSGEEESDDESEDGAEEAEPWDEEDETLEAVWVDWYVQTFTEWCLGQDLEDLVRRGQKETLASRIAELQL